MEIKMIEKITLKLEFYLRGKNRIPSVSFHEVNNYGVPLTSNADVPGTPAGDAFYAFSKAAHKFCKAMKDVGEFNPGSER
jgi:hypothetical protein